jgi:LmbE family N-acetylglucosaminyl deacetylase
VTRSDEARSAASMLIGAERAERINIRDFRGAYFPADWQDIKDFLESLKPIDPDIVFAHHRDDLHQDHRIIGELVWNTFRNHLILEFEIPKYDGGLGSPSVFVPVDDEAARRKVEVLMTAFPSQQSRAWFTPSTFEALMRLRGVECNAPSGYAEAFYARKIVLRTS